MTMAMRKVITIMEQPVCETGLNSTVTKPTFPSIINNITIISIVTTIITTCNNMNKNSDTSQKKKKNRNGY